MGDLLFDIADTLQKKKLLRFAEQLRGAGMSISGNIAGGSGSSSQEEFGRFLNMSKKSTFEVANILVMLGRKNVISKEMCDSYLERIDLLCRKITNLQKALTK